MKKSKPNSKCLICGRVYSGHKSIASHLRTKHHTSQQIGTTYEKTTLKPSPPLKTKTRKPRTDTAKKKIVRPTGSNQKYIETLLKIRIPITVGEVEIIAMTLD